jgi:hypothetical protein
MDRQSLYWLMLLAQNGFDSEGNYIEFNEADIQAALEMELDELLAALGLDPGDAGW